MATKKVNSKKSNKDTGLIAQAKVANEIALEVGGELVNMGLSTGKTAQGIYEKVLTGSVKLFGMQQKFVLDTLEQTITNEQFKSFVQIPVNFFNQAMIATEAKVADLKTEGSKIVEKASDFVEDAKGKVENAFEKGKDKVEDALEAGKEKVEEVLEAGKDDLTRINGIGPKTAEIFNEAGYFTYAQIATADVEELKAILEKAGTRYAAMDPTGWIEQAVFAASENWDGLAKWVKENI